MAAGTWEAFSQHRPPCVMPAVRVVIRRSSTHPTGKICLQQRQRRHQRWRTEKIRADTAEGKTDPAKQRQRQQQQQQQQQQQHEAEAPAAAL